MIEIIAIVVLAAAFLLFIVLALCGYSIGTYNGLTEAFQDIETQFSNIRTEYQRRSDLFFNLVEATKSHKKFEKSTLIEVMKARQGNFGTTKPEQLKSMSKLDGIFGKLAVVFENYPNLKSNEQHNKLMDETRITEDRINIARTDFNEEVREYNIMCKTFPSKLIAGMFGFKVYPYYMNDSETNKPMRMNLD